MKVMTTQASALVKALGAQSLAVQAMASVLGQKEKAEVGEVKEELQGASEKDEGRAPEDR